MSAPSDDPEKEVAELKEELKGVKTKLERLNLLPKGFTPQDLQEAVPRHFTNPWTEEDCKSPFKRMITEKEKLEDEKKTLGGLLLTAQNRAKELRDKADVVTKEDRLEALERRQSEIEHKLHRKRLYSEFSEENTRTTSIMSLGDVATVTGGTLDYNQAKAVDNAMEDHIRSWEKDNEIDRSKISEVAMGTFQHGFPTLEALFARAGLPTLHLVNIEHSQVWNLSGSAESMHPHYEGKRRGVRWSSARPDYIVVSASLRDFVYKSTPCMDVLKQQKSDIVFVEVQSGGKPRKIGINHLKMALMGAFGFWKGTYYGLFVQKENYLHEAQLLRVENDNGSPKIYEDGSFGAPKIPSLCDLLINRQGS